MPIRPGSIGSCPFCGVANRFEAVRAIVHSSNLRPETRSLIAINIIDGAGDSDREIVIARCTNSNCRRTTIAYNFQMCVPLSTQRPVPQPEVPSEIANDYSEACLVEPLSNKAAAALARRCLQNLLHDRGIKAPNLEKEIEEAMKSLPTHLAQDIDAIRHYGNFAAHPTKSVNTGFIVNVEPDEAAYLLDTLHDLFDHYYVRPAKSAARRAALQQKIDDAGKNIKIK